MNFQGVMVQLAPRVMIRQTNLGIQLRTLRGSSKNREIRADAYGWQEQRHGKCPACKLEVVERSAQVRSCPLLTHGKMCE